MALATQYPGFIVIAEDPQNIIFGTCQISDAFGEVKSAGIKRTADKEELDNAKGALKAAILKKPRFELTLKVLFTAEKDAPGIGEQIVFPLVEVVGRILDISIDWEDATGRMMTIQATKWDSLTGETAESYDGSAWTPLVDTVEVDTVAPTITSATINAAGDQLTLVMSEPCSVPVIVTGITVDASGSGSVSAIYASGSGTSSIIYNLSTRIYLGETCTLAHAPGSGSVFQSLRGVPLGAISAGAVVNNSNYD